MTKTELAEILKKQILLLHEVSKTRSALNNHSDVSSTMVALAKTMYAMNLTDSVHDEIKKTLEKQLQLLSECSEKCTLAEEVSDISSAIRVIGEAILEF